MMHPVKAIAIGLLAWPAAEFIAFLVVAAAIGFLNAILLIVLMSMAGALVLRHFGSVQQIQTAGGFVTASSWRGEMAPALGGILLMIPGFISSLAGLAVLFPLSRHLLLAGVRRAFTSARTSPASPDVVDLAPTEWRTLPDHKLPPAGTAPGKTSPGKIE
jgi:UPF0716 protein FxsA